MNLSSRLTKRAITIMRSAFGVLAFFALNFSPAFGQTIPDAPNLGIVSAVPGGISVAFTPPAFDGGSPITRYQATCGGQYRGSAVSSPVIVRGIAQYLSVTCYVEAINAIGTSGVLAISSAVTPLPPVNTALYFHSQPGAFVGFGHTQTVSPAVGFAAGLDSNPGAGVVISMNNLNGSSPLGIFWILKVRAADSQALQAGNYDGAKYYEAATPGFPALSFAGDGVGCEIAFGKFRVLDIQRDIGGNITSLAIDFEQRCTGAAGSVYGQLRYNSTVPIDPTQRVPDPMTFLPVVGAATSIVVTSPPASIVGIDVQVPVSITGGEYSIDNGPFTATTGIVGNGQSLRVRLSSAPTANSLRTATIDVGGMESAFMVGTALGSNPQPTGGTLIHLVGIPTNVSGNILSSFYSDAAADQITLKRSPSSPPGGIVFVDASPYPHTFSTWSATIRGVNGVKLAPGTYQGVGADSNATHMGLAAGGPNPPFCYSDAIAYVLIHEVEYDVADDPVKLAADFVQTCGPNSPHSRVHGHVRVNSAVPIDYALNLPIPFSFAGIAGAATNAPVTSTAALIAGINVDIPISVSGGEYSINGGAFTALPGMISNGQSVRVRLVSAATANTLRSATLTVGGETAAFKVGTAVVPNPQPNGDTLITLFAQAPNTSSSPASRVFSAAALSTISLTNNPGVVGSTLAIVVSGTSNQGDYSLSAFIVSKTLSRLVTGTFPNLPDGQDESDLKFKLYSDGYYAPTYCSTGHARPNLTTLSIHEIEYAQDGTLTKLALDFIQTCVSTFTYPRIHGHVRFNTTLPIDYAIRLPVPVAFTPKSDIATNTVVEWPPVSVVGITESIPISIVNGEYNIDNGPYTAVAGTVSNGQSVRVRMTSAPTPNTLKVGQLHLGGYSAPFQAGTAAGYTPQPGSDPMIVVVGIPVNEQSGVTRRVFSPANTDFVALEKRSGGGTTISVTDIGQNFSRWSAMLAADGQLPVMPGTYSGAQSNPTPNAPLLSITSDPACHNYYGSGTGSMVIHEVEYLPDGTPTKLAADLVQTCSADYETYTYVYAYVRINSVVPIDYTIVTPAPFSFTTIAGVAPGSVQVSNTVTIRGNTVPVPISISGGEYSVDGGAFTAAAGMIGPDQQLRLRLTAAGVANQLVSASVTVAGQTKSFTVATAPGSNPQPDGTPLIVLRARNSQTGQMTDTIYSPATLRGVLLEPPPSGYGYRTRIRVWGSPSSDIWHANLAGPNGTLLTTGVFENALSQLNPTTALFDTSATSYSPACSDNPRLPISFKVHEVEHSVSGETQKLAMDFTQVCSNSIYTPSVIFGYVRINSLVPIDYTIRRPDKMTFTPVTGAMLSSNVESNEVTIAGITVAVPVTIAGGAYSIDGAPYTAAPGTIAVGQKLRIRLTTSASNNTLSTATISVGEGAADFRVGTVVGGVPSANGAPIVYMISQGGENLGQGHTYTYSPATMSAVTFMQNFRNGASIGIDRPTENAWQPWLFEFNAAGGVPLTPGIFGNASGASSSATPQIAITRAPNYCYADNSEFTVHEIVYNGTSIDKLAVDFIHYCSGNSNPLYGYIRINSAIAINPIADGVPAPFPFAEMINVQRNSQIVSAPVVIQDFSGVAAISIVGGEFSVDGGAFTAAPGFVSAGQSIRARVTSSAIFSIQVSTTVIIGGVQSVFKATTAARSTTPDPFFFGFVSGAALNQWIDSTVVTPVGINDIANVTVSGGEVSIGGRPFTSAPSAIAPGETVQVRLLASGAYGDYRTVILTVGNYTTQFLVQTIVKVRVSVSVGGTGTVISNPAGIVCPGNCSALFDQGSQLTLIARPGTGAGLNGWSGGGCSGTGDCVLTVGSTTTITANFVAQPPGAPTIGSALPGNGQVTLLVTPPATVNGPSISVYTATCNPGSVTVSTGQTTITIGGLTNETTYSCSVTAANSIGTSASSASISITPSAVIGLALIGVQSRKNHGPSGQFDLPINNLIPIEGAVTIEPRVMGSAHVIVFQFNASVNSIGGVTVLDASSMTIGNPVVSWLGSEVSVALVGTLDGKRISIALGGVNGAMNVSTAVGFLLGDVDNSYSVNARDLSAAKVQSGSSASANNFRFDINLSGTVSAPDLAGIKARAGNTLN